MAGEDLNIVVIHCKGLLFDDEGRLLLVRQAESIGTYWNAPGGRLDDGESLEECLRREILEETGLVVESARLVFSHTFLSPGRTDIYFGFHVTEYSGTLGVGATHTESEQQEITDIRFIGQNEKLADPLYPAGLWEAARSCLSGELDVQYLGTESPQTYA